MIYNRYMEAYRTGVFSFIKEDYDYLTNDVISRKYFSGGIPLNEVNIDSNPAMLPSKDLTGTGHRLRVDIQSVGDKASLADDAAASDYTGEVMYHVTTAEMWMGQKDGRDYAPEDFGEGSFIHFSSDFETALVMANRIYAKSSQDLVVVEAHTSAARKNRRITVDPGKERYPHLYGPLPTSAVSRVIPLIRGADGQWVESDVFTPIVRGDAAQLTIQKEEFQSLSEGIETAGITIRGMDEDRSGRAVRLDPQQVELRVWVSPDVAAYDFSQFAMTESTAARYGKKFQANPGQSVRDFVSGDEGKLFAGGGHVGGFWTGNSMAVVGGVLITKNVPGIAQKIVEDSKGKFSFFVFDQGKVGLMDIDMAADDVAEQIKNIGYAINGPVLIRNGRDVSASIRPAMPPRGTNEVTWALDRVQLFSIIGKDKNGRIVHLSLMDLQLAQAAKVAIELGLTDAVVLGVSSDAVQFVRDDQNELIEPSPGVGSETGVAGRPLGSILYAKRRADAPAGELQHGGIDLNDITMTRKGVGVDMAFDPAQLSDIIDAGMTGFSPVIINMTPLPSIFPLLGLPPQRDRDDLKLSQM